MRMTGLVLAVLVCCAGQGAFAAVRATITPAQGRIGDTFVYVVEADPSMAGADIGLPEPGMVAAPVEKDAPESAAAVPLYEILSVRKDEQASRVEVRLTWYRPGRHYAPVLAVTDNTGNAAGYDVPEVEITAVNEQGEFAEIDPPGGPGFNFLRLLLILAGLAVLAAVLWLAWRMFTRRKKAGNPVQAPDAKTVFLDAVAGLKKAELLTQDQRTEFVFQTFGNFRTYLAAMLPLNAPEMTAKKFCLV
jgi:hypothetical protein